MQISKLGKVQSFKGTLMVKDYSSHKRIKPEDITHISPITNRGIIGFTIRDVKGNAYKTYGHSSYKDIASAIALSKMNDKIEVHL